MNARRLAEEAERFAQVVRLKVAVVYTELGGAGKTEAAQ